MALAQRHIAQPLPRSLILPRRHAAAHVASRSRSLHVQVSLTVCVVAATCLVTYICGYSRMTAANYQKFIIQQEMQKLRVQHQLLCAKALELGEKDRIESWARENGMSPATGIPV